MRCQCRCVIDYFSVTDNSTWFILVENIDVDLSGGCNETAANVRAGTVLREEGSECASCLD